MTFTVLSAIPPASNVIVGISISPELGEIGRWTLLNPKRYKTRSVPSIKLALLVELGEGLEGDHALPLGVTNSNDLLDLLG